MVSAEYQAEVDRATASAEARYRQGQARLVAAENRANRVRLRRVRTAAESRAKIKALAVADALVELRRAELLELARLMQSAPAAAHHRGRRSYGPVPASPTLL